MKAQTSSVNGIISSVIGGPQLLAVTYLGPLTDRTGRRVVLLLAVMGQVISGLAALAVWYWHLNVYYLAIGSVLNGLSGSYAAFIAVSFAYVADFTNPNERALVFGAAESMCFAASAIGPLTLGFIAENFGTPISLWSLVILGLLSSVFVLFLPSASRRAKTDAYHKDESVVKGCLRNNLITALVTLFRRPRAVMLVSLAFMLDFVAFLSLLCVTTQYTQVAFGWHGSRIGLNSTLNGIARTLGVWCVLPVFLHGPRCLQLSELNIMRLAVVASIAASFGYAFVTDGAIFTALAALGSLHGLLVPLSRNIMSTSFDERNQGVALSVVAMIESISSLWVPAASGFVFAYFLENEIPSQYFFVLAGFGLATLATLLATREGQLDAARILSSDHITKNKGNSLTETLVQDNDKRSTCTDDEPSETICERTQATSVIQYTY